MIVLKVTFESALSEQDVYRVAEERLPQFRAIPGLAQKYYLKAAEPNHYSGVYVWDCMESLQNFRQSELAASIPAAYQVKGQPQMEVGEVFIQLRD